MPDDRDLRPAPRATIKDIASRAGVAVSTVHAALHGKPGVSEATRDRIIAIAEAQSYRPNAAAASLRRDGLTLAAMLPATRSEDRPFYSQMWEGVRDQVRAVEDLNVRLVEVPLPEDPDGADPLAELEVDGILTTGYGPRGHKTALRTDAIAVPTVLVGNDSDAVRRLCCVQPHYGIIGATMAELLARQVPGGTGILVCAGEPAVPSHYEVVDGFEKYLRDNGVDLTVHTVAASEGDASFSEEVRALLARPDTIGGCASVTAHHSVLLADALAASGRAGEVPAIGSDLFAQNVAFLRRGVLTNLVSKNPFEQARRAAQYLIEHLVLGKEPPRERVYVASEVVFRSSIELYDPRSFRIDT